MLSFFSAVWEWIVWFVTALLPFKQGLSIPPVVRWIIWTILDLSFLILLYFLNDWANLAQFVTRVPFNLTEQAPRLKDFYLPILGQLFIFMGIVLYWFYLLWFADPDDSPFPDIDEAWLEAMQTLERAGIQLPRTPLFLVLGKPASAEQHLFEAAGLKLVVKQTPTSPHAPVHVFADREAVYVTCHDASVLGKLASILSLEDISEGSIVRGQETGDDPDKTLRPGSKEQAIIEMLRASVTQEASPGRKRTMRRAALGRPLGHDVLSDPKEVGRYRARLAHVCRLISRDRQPYCAANGILLLVPIAGTDSSGEAQFTAQAAQDDLATVRHEMKLDCPLVTLVVDMEEFPGFVEFMQRQPPRELGNRRGNGFPMSTRLSRDEVLEQVGMSLSWVCTTYVQDSVYRVLKNETPNDTDVPALFPGNAHLVLLLAEMNERADSLSVIIQQAIGPDADSLLRYAGCYLAATGEKGTQAFVSGVFQKLVKEQSAVSWTQAALYEDAHSHTWANYYFMMAGVLTLAWGLLLAWLIVRAFG